MGTSSEKVAGPAAETRERILDTARELFADHGFSSVSLRQITSQADVNLAAVNYHFGSKEALITEVLTRMITPINRDRIRLLDSAEASHGKNPVPIEEVLRAFYEPILTALADSDEHDASVFLKLAGRCMVDEGDVFDSQDMIEMFSEVIDRFFVAMEKSLPHLTPSDLQWRFHFAVGTHLYMLTKDDRLQLISRGEQSAMRDLERTLDELIAFTAAGMQAESVRNKSGRKGSSALTAAASACFAILLASCAGKSPESAAHLARIDFPKHWMAGEGQATGPVADSSWIEDFGDSKLTAFVEKALEQNRSLQAAAARVDIAAANARLSGVDLYPQIDGTFSSRRSKQNFIGFPFGGEGGGGADPGVVANHFNQFGLSLDVSWELDLWGRLRAAQSSAIAAFEASEFDRSSAELSLAAQAAKAWFAIAEAREQVALAKATLETFGDTEETIRERYRQGIDQPGSNLASQLLLSETDSATAREALAIREELVERTARQLEIIAGEYPAGTAAQSATLPTLSSTVPAGIPADLLDRRPDVAAAERRLAAADMKYLEAKRSALPRISLTSSGGTSSEQIEDLLDGNFSVWSLAANAVQPILRGGVIKNGINLRNAERRAVVHDFESTTLTAFSEVENTLAAEKYLRRREAAVADAARLSSEAYERAREEYVGGTGDLLTMLTAQQRMFAQRSQSIAIRRLRLENRVNLHLALGGSFKPIPAKNPAPPEPAKPNQ
ncbi:MAG: efflux transporter outer membrane subunit [Verrucomicrobiales bacterium]|nr:efflux transporter outer membrane subunit [Verrucomicrobiales bacterium]